METLKINGLISKIWPFGIWVLNSLFKKLSFSPSSLLNHFVWPKSTRKDKLNLEEDLPPEDDDFVVDEEGNAVRYDNDEEEEYDDEGVIKEKPKIMKLIANMKQGEKEIKSTKVPKSLFNKKKDKLDWNWLFKKSTLY